MTQRSRREGLLREQTAVQGMADAAAGHWLMEPQFKQRLQEIEGELAKLSESGVEPKLEVYFSGGPVRGSEAIDAKFLAEVLPPLLETVKSQYSSAKYGRLGQRGPRKDESEARLMLASTPRGSFGVELVPPQTDDLFAEQRVADVLYAVTTAVESAAGSEKELFSMIDELEPRAYTSMKEFFQRLADADASVRLESGEAHVLLNADQVKVANQRLSESRVIEETRELHGRFRGALLDTWRFNFTPDSGEPISGRIHPDLSEEAVANLSVNDPVTLRILETITTTPTGKQHRKYVLLGRALG